MTPTKSVSASSAGAVASAIIVATISLLTYLLPLVVLTKNNNNNNYLGEEAVLDETFLFPSPSQRSASIGNVNLDILGTTKTNMDGSTRWDLLTNDYWGRPIFSKESHKSWRPLSVLTFRIWNNDLDGVGWFRGWVPVEVFPVVVVHRVTNVIIHAILVHLTGMLAVRLFPPHPPTHPAPSSVLLRTLSSLLFAVHPAHVECVANGANRPHLLALLFSLLLVIPFSDDHGGRGEFNSSWTSLSQRLVMDSVLTAMGLLSCETAVFHLPAILCTMTVVTWKRRRRRRRRIRHRQRGRSDEDGTSPNDDDGGTGTMMSPQSSSSSSLEDTIVDLLPRYYVISLVTATYLTVRYCTDTFTIPTEMLRRIEVPFVNLTGYERLWSYMYVTAVHVAKAFMVDDPVVGYSHEYGYDCIKPVGGWTDVRMVLPMGLIVVMAMALFWAVRKGKQIQPKQQRRGRRRQRDDVDEMDTEDEDAYLEPAMDLVVAMSWMLTLFPVCGILRAATFVGDRHVLGASLVVSMFGGSILAQWVDRGANHATTTEAKSEEENGNKTSTRTLRSRPLRMAILVFVLTLLGWKVVNRTSNWTSNLRLYRSSLETCPRSVKILLQLSRFHSGRYDDAIDLDLALTYAQKAEQIDASYCNVHYQIAHVLKLKEEYLEMEHRLMEAMECPPTFHKASAAWSTYWSDIVDPDDDDARERKQVHRKAMRDTKKKRWEENLKKMKEGTREVVRGDGDGMGGEL